MSRRTGSLLLALCLLLGLLGGCGRNNPEPVMAGEGAFGADTESVVPSPSPGTEAGNETRSAWASGSFSMPCNNSYGWNPYECLGMENRAVMQLLYEGLFVLNNQFDAEPMLCKSYTLSEDGYTYTLELQTANFSNGKAMTADDVVYSINQAMSSTLYAGRLIDIYACYNSGEHTVTIEMNRPNDRLPCLLTFPIVPSFSNLSAAPAGTGPFVKSAGDTLTVNQDWWQGAENLQFQSVSLYSSASAEDTRDSFEIDAVHLVYNNPNSSTAATFHSDYELWNSRGTTMQYLAFNTNRGIFQDQKARVAVSHAINRVDIAESVYHNFADAAVLPAAPSCSMYDETLAQQYAFTSVKSATDELLTTDYFYLPQTSPGVSPSPTPEPELEEEEDEADEEDEDAEANSEKESGTYYNSIVMIVHSGNLKRTASAKAVAEDLTDVGFHVEIKELAGDEFYYNLNLGEWDILFGEATLQPDFDLRPLLASGGSLSYGGAGGAGDLDDLMAKARENSGNYYDLYEYIMENGYLCPILFLNNAVFTTRGVFTGLNPSPDCLFYHITNIQVQHE